MNKSIIHNFILIVAIPLIMFLGLSLRSYASGVASNTFQIKHSNTSYNDNNRNCTINLSGSPNFSIGKETNSTSYQGDTIYATLKVTTSEGTFDIKSSNTYISSSTSSSNLGFNDLGSITLPGYFINLYVDYSSGIYKSGDLIATEYGQITSSSMYTTYSGDINGRMVPTYDMARISSIGNSSYGSFVNGSYPIIDNSDNPISFEYAGSNEILAYDPYTCYYITPNTIKFSVSNPKTNWGYNAYIFTLDGKEFCVKSESFTNNNLSVNTTFQGGYYSSRPLKMFIRLWGVNTISDVTFTYQNWSFYTAPTSIKNEWNTIANSDELEHLENISVSMNEILSDNNDTFNNDFSDYNSNISSVDLTGSSTDANRLTIATRFLFNGFYNGLNDNFKKYIRIVLNIGLAMMVLTVGTRVVAHKGYLHG